LLKKKLKIKYPEFLNSRPGLVIFVFLRVGSGKNCQLLLGEETRKESLWPRSQWGGVVEQEYKNIRSKYTFGIIIVRI
jgi:hypothetical protein